MVAVRILEGHKVGRSFVVEERSLVAEEHILADIQAVERILPLKGEIEERNLADCREYHYYMLVEEHIQAPEQAARREYQHYMLVGQMVLVHTVVHKLPVVHKQFLYSLQIPYRFKFFRE